MAEKVIMPKQGLQMTEGTILSWLVKEGEVCEEGKPLFEMETDKLTITMDAPASGTLLKIVRGEGEVVPITELIAVIGTPGEDISGILAEAAPAAAPADTASDNLTHDTSPAPAAVPVKGTPAVGETGARKFSTPRARMRAEEKKIDIADVPATGPENLVIERDVLSYVPAPAVKASPLAKKVAELEGVDLADVQGSGSHGKIMKNDILSAVAARAAAKAAVAEGKGSGREPRLVPMSKSRKIIGDRMVESLQTMAQLQHTVNVDMTNAAALRAAYKKKDIKISYNDIVLKAVTCALMDYPMANASIKDGSLEMHDYVNIGMAVAIDGGLVVPNIKDADLLRLEEISAQAKELGSKAKNNTLTLDEMTGGTFTVSNLGMFGIDEFTAIVNPPEAGILACGAMKKTPVVIDDEIVIRPIMKITLSYDHRIMDGAPAAQFIVRIKEYIEQPVLML